MTDTSARDAARSLVASGAGFDARVVERGAFASEPGIRDLLVDTDAARTRVPGRASLAAGLGTVLLEFAPVIAAGVLITPTRLDADLTVPAIIAVVVTLASVVSRVVVWVQLTKGRAEISGSRIAINAVSVLFAVLTVFLMSFAAGSLPVPALVLGAFVLQGLASATTAIALFRAGRRGTAPRIPATDIDRLRTAIADLPEHRRAAITADIEAALRTSVDTGLLSSDDADVLARAPLGGLARAHWAMSQATRR